MKWQKIDMRSKRTWPPELKVLLFWPKEAERIHEARTGVFQSKPITLLSKKLTPIVWSSGVGNRTLKMYSHWRHININTPEEETPEEPDVVVPPTNIKPTSNEQLPDIDLYARERDARPRRMYSGGWNR